MRGSLVLSLVLGSGCVAVHDGDGVSKTEFRDLGFFDAVLDESRFDVQIQMGDTQSVAVTCDSNLVELLWTENDNGVLVIHVEESGHTVILPHTDCGVAVTTPELISLESSGSGDLTVTGDGPLALTDLVTSGSGDLIVHTPVSVPSLVASSTGSGGVQLDNLSADEVAFTTTGSGDLHVLDGGVGALHLVSTGSGDMSLAGMWANAARAVLSGSGDAEITVVQSLEATLTGSGDLTVFGSPPVRDIESTGSGDVLLGG